MPRIPLARYLEALIALCALPLLALAGYLAFDRFQTVREDQEASAEARAAALARQVDIFISSRLDALEMLAASPLLDDPPQLDRFYRVAQGFRKAFGTHVLVAEPSLAVVLNTRAPFGTPLPPLARYDGHSRSAAGAVADQGGRQVGDVVVGPLAGEPLVGIAVPVVREGVTRWVLVTNAETRRVSEVIDGGTWAPGWSALLKDGTGAVIARFPPGAPPAADDDHVFTAPVAGASWRVEVRLANQTYYAPMFAAAAGLTAALVVAVLATLFGARFASRRLVRDIASLGEAPGAGDPPRGIAEVEAVRQRLAEASASLATSDARLTFALRESNTGGWDLDAASGTLHRTPEHDSIFGYDRPVPRWTFATTLAHVVPEDRERLQRAVDDAARNGEASVEVRIRRADGATRWIWLSGGSLHAAPECVGRLSGIVQDITDRKAAEVRWREGEERLRLALDAARMGIFDWDMATGVIAWSGVHEALWGYPPGGYDGTYGGFARRVHAEDLPGLEAAVQRCIVAREPYTHEFRVVWPDGSVHWISGHGRVELDGDGTAVRMRGVVLDISERVQAREATQRMHETYQRLLATTPDAVWVVDGTGRIVDVNEAACRMIGYERDDLLGRPVSDIEARESPEDVRRHVEEIRQAGAHRFETRHRCKDGRVLDVEVSAAWITSSARVYAFVRDVSERKRLEDTRLRTRKLEALGTLAGGIAHDFNNLLSAIRGNAELAAHEVGVHHPALTSIAEVQKAGARAAELVRRITAFGRPAEPRREILDLAVVTDEVLKLLRPTLPAGIALASRFDAGVPRVMADASQVHEALVNLTTNAAHAIGKGGGTIDYRLDVVDVDGELAARLGLAPGRYSRLAVRDDGCGMDGATRARAFDAFFTTKPMGEGTGLGLSMVYGTMQGHGGAVAVDSEPGRGSTFRLYFPSAANVPPRDPPWAGTAPHAVAGRRLLYLDDEESLVFLAERALRRLGHQVTAFTDPQEALAVFAARPDAFDVVVTDLAMPGLSGFEFARALRALRPDVPIVMTTGYLRPGDEAEARDCGIRRIMLKAGTIGELAADIDRALEDASGAGVRD